MHQALRRVAASRLLWAVAMLLLLYTLGGFMLAPYLIERYLPRYAEQHLGQRATVSAVRINPFLLTVEASGFRLAGSGDSSMLAFTRLWVDFELSSIVRRAWTFGEIKMEDLDLQLEIDSDGRLNLMELMGPLRDPEKEREGLPRLVIEHLAVSDSHVTLVDLSGETRASVAFAPVNLELANLSTLPDNEGHYTLAARLSSGGSLAWKGDVSLQPLASSGEISIRGVKLSTVWQFLRDRLSVAELGGELVLTGRYDFVYEQSTPALDVNRLQGEVSGLALAPAPDAPALLALRTIRMSDARFALASRELVVPRLRLSAGELSASVADDGTLDWQSLVVRESSGQSQDENRPPGGQPWRVRLESIGIEKVALTYTDRSTMPELVVHAETLNGGLMLDVTTGAGPSHVVAEDIQLAVSGTVLAAPESDTPLARLDSFVLTGGRVDTRVPSVLAQTLAMSGGGVKIARGRNGPRGLLHALLSARPKSTAATRSSARKPAAGASPWQYRIDAVELKRFEVDLADHSFKPAITYDIDVVSAALTHIKSASAAPIAFKTELRIGERGTVESGGTLRQDLRQASARVDAASIALEPLRPFLARYALLDFRSGNLSVSAQVNYRPDAKTAFTAEGVASVQDFRLNEADTGDRFLSWKMLSAESIVLSLSPNRLAIKELRVLEAGMKIVIAKDGTINLTQVFKGNPHHGAPANEQLSAGPATRSGEGRDTPSFPVEVGRIRLEGGTLDFADLSLILPFSTQVHALGGSIVGVSSAPKNRAELRLAGQIETYGEARAEGTLIPWSPRTFLDIEAHFDNVRMPPLSPYSATFAGRKVAAGKLWLDLHYKIVNGELAGEHKIVLEDLKLGERIEAPNALDLPFDLAIALLTDSKGKIRLAVPVTGDVDDPKFDYGNVIRAALTRVITRVVTAPFRMLAGLFGKRNAEELSKVEFKPGSDRIAPAQREKLDSLAEALKQRPQLKLVVHGPYDVKRDGERLRRERVRRDLARMVDAKLEPEEDPGPIAYGDADTQNALEKLLTERAGSDAVRSFASQYAKRTGLQPEPVNPLLSLIGRESADHAYYKAMFAQLVELQPLPDSAPQVLAAERAQVIIDALRKAGIDRSRLQSGGTTQVTGGSSAAIASEFTLEVMPKVNS